MAKRKAKRSIPKATSAGPAARLRQALSKRRKAELVDLLVDLATNDSALSRRLAAKFEVTVPPQELVAATRRAIADATDFDEREINRNFSYDHAAYDEIKRNFVRLIAMGQLGSAMDLALKLMDEGSYQVEMSDEGLMSHDIEECLAVVIKALRKCDLPAAEIAIWCSKMLKKDRVGFISTDALQSLRVRFTS